tara:strand:- start:3568 stop:4041 length:474 start_codon:yes stop_codon:yes gene_type:complete
MDLLNFFQFIQALLAIFVVLCLCTKGPVKHHCHVALVVLVISIMIIPPFGRNFLSAASMKEGATNANKKYNRTEHELDAIKQMCEMADMTVADLGKLANMSEGTSTTGLSKTQQAILTIMDRNIKDLKNMTVHDLYLTLKTAGIENYKKYCTPHTNK